MANKIAELFGYASDDKSAAASAARDNSTCPFLGNGTGQCAKEIGDKSNRIKSGVCAISDRDGTPVIVCPIRMYANHYRLLQDVAKLAFDVNAVQLVKATDIDTPASQKDTTRVVVFGKGWGGELRVPGRTDNSIDGSKRTTSFFVDWILVRLDANNDLIDFEALEVQTMDTIGSYREERTAHLAGTPHHGKSAGINWENVNKRILPQLIYKGHLLEREKLCNAGLFFACPEPVYLKILGRLGEALAEYPLKNNALTFCAYGLGVATTGQPRELSSTIVATTTVQQVQIAFSSPKNLPPAGAYEHAIRTALSRGKQSKSSTR